jgi:cytochrome c oxidase cbb3-type subunit 3
VAQGFGPAVIAALKRCATFFAVLVLASLSACGKTPGDIRTSDATPPIRTPVGPVPGPVDRAPRPANPFTSDRGAMGEGRRLFTSFNCAGCHGDHAGGGMGPSLRDVDWIYGKDDGQIFSSIAEGRARGMPAWHSKLTQDQIWRLVAYIKSLRTRNEPQPPV